MRDRWESVETSLIQQGHHGSFDDIILMVRIGDFVAAELHCLLVQGTFPHFGAQSTRIGLFTRLKKDFTDLEYISSAGLRVLLVTSKMMKGKGRFVIRNINETVREIFEVTGFLDILTVE